MLTMIVGLWLVRILSVRAVRRVQRSGAPPHEQVRLLRRSGSIPSRLGLVLGLLAAGEVLLEVPSLAAAWGLVGAAVAYLFRVAASAVWLDALIDPIGRLAGSPVPYGVAMARGLRTVAVGLFPPYAVTGVALQVASSGVTGAQLAVVYLLFVLVTVVGAPLLHRLGTATRGLTPEEAERIGRVSDTFGLGLDEVRVELGGDNAQVAGVGPGARIFVGERLVAGPEDELAAVLAHEVAHRDRHHIAWRALLGVVFGVAMAVIALVVLPSAPSHGGDALTAILVIAVTLPVLRYFLLGVVKVQQEHAADAFAAGRVGAVPLGRFLVRHPDGLRLHQRGSMRHRLRSGHPTTAERLAALRLEVSTTPATEG